MSTITIASIELKPKRSVAITTENRRLGFFRELAVDFQIGATYEIETKATELDGKTLVNIVKAKQVAAPCAPAATPFVSGAYRQPEGNSAPAVHGGKDEQIWVQGILQAAIKAGHIPFEKQALWSATQMLRGLYQHTFGHPASESGRHAA